MSSSITLKNLENTEFKIEHKDGRGAKTIYGSDISVAVDTINDFPTNPNDGDVCIVRDLNRGGTFIYDSTEVANSNDGTNFNGWIRQYSGAVNVKWFGAKGDGITDDTYAIQTAINQGYSTVGNNEDVYIITSKIEPLSNQYIDFNNATLKVAGGSEFTSTDSAIEINNNGVTLVNFNIDGNKASVSHPAVTGSNLAGIVVRASNITIKDGSIKNCVTNGVICYASGIYNISFTNLNIEDNGWVAIGNEIPTQGDAVAEDIVFDGINTTGNGIGGLYIASGKNITVSNSSFNDGNRSYLYIGDADGGLFNCKVSNTKFATTNAGASTLTIEGEVQTGALTGNKNTCEVFLSNVEIYGAGGGYGLSVNGDAILYGNNISIENTFTGFGLFDNSRAFVDGIYIKNVSGSGIQVYNKCSLSNVTIENYVTSGIYFDIGSQGCVIDNIVVGKASGETGNHGFWGTSSAMIEHVISNYVFNGTGAQFNATAVNLSTWTITNTDGVDVYDFIQYGTWNKKAIYLGSGYIWVDATGDVRVKITKPTSDTDGTVVGTQA